MTLTFRLFLQIPKIDIVSNAKPSMFAYPSPYKPPAKEKVEKVATAVLSTTAKAQARAKTKEQDKAAVDGVDAMDTVSENLKTLHTEKTYADTPLACPAGRQAYRIWCNGRKQN